MLEKKDIVRVYSCSLNLAQWLISIHIQYSHTIKKNKMLIQSSLLTFSL